MQIHASEKHIGSIFRMKIWAEKIGSKEIPVSRFFTPLFSNPEDGDRMFNRNIGIYLPVHGDAKLQENSA
jgi:hypothetical protein